MKWTNSSSNTDCGSVSTQSSNSNASVDRRQSIFYTSEATIPVNSPPIVILDQKFNGVSSKSAGVNEIKMKETVSVNFFANN